MCFRVVASPANLKTPYLRQIMMELVRILNLMVTVGVNVASVSIKLLVMTTAP